jgi:hypothetical protein
LNERKKFVFLTVVEDDLFRQFTVRAIVRRAVPPVVVDLQTVTFYLNKLYEQTALRLTWDDLWRKREIEVEGSWLHEFYQVKTRRRLRLQRFRVFGLHQAMR